MIFYNYGLCDFNDYSLDDLEKVRANAFDLDYRHISNLYRNELENGKMLAYICTGDKKILGGAYVSNSFNSLYIEQLFVAKSYQNKHIGTNLLKYVLNDKYNIERYFNQEFNYSKLTDITDSDFYTNMGYKDGNSRFYSLKKRL
ncbi:MAG: GNAT family N-acetyltransferase [Bacilli bacterium]|nr:GNAT family N-acetyltransferase [Bacilli bacterium]